MLFSPTASGLELMLITQRLQVIDETRLIFAMSLAPLTSGSRNPRYMSNLQRIYPVILPAVYHLLLAWGFLSSTCVDPLLQNCGDPANGIGCEWGDC
jgi:hypothetical protein